MINMIYTNRSSGWPGLDGPVSLLMNVVVNVEHSSVDLSELNCSLKSSNQIGKIKLICADREPVQWPILNDHKCDPDVLWIRDLLKSNKKPHKDDINNAVRRCFASHFDALSFDDQFVYFNDLDRLGQVRKRIVIGSNDVKKVIQFVHGSALGGHLGMNRTFEKLSEHIFRPQLRLLVEQEISTCHTCQINKNPTTTARAQLQPISASCPLELITTDIMGPLPCTPRQNKYILVICDHFSKWVQAYALSTMRAEDVAACIVDFFFKFGIATNILSDQGKNYQSDLFKQVCELLDVNKLQTTAYHPECDGLSERFNRTLKEMLRCFINDNHSNWDELLSSLCFAYNTSVHSTTNTTPFEVLFGRKPKLPLDLVLGSGL